jgi:hypothetical protein
VTTLLKYKGTNITHKRSTSKEGGTFTVAKNDSREVEEDEDLPLSTYEEHLCEIRVIVFNIGGDDPIFGGNCVSELRIACVQVDDMITPL